MDNWTIDVYHRFVCRSSHSMTDKKVTCNYLWKQWEKREPNATQVIQGQEKISTYSKSDWQNMVIDAEETVAALSYLIENNIDIKDKRSEMAFEKILNHVRKYFFEPDSEYIKKIYSSLIFDKDYIKFFNQFNAGMSSKIVELIETYPEKIKKV